MADSFSKKEIFKKKLNKKKEKAEKREFKKENNNKGKSLEENFIYVDIFGRFTDVPTHLQDRSERPDNRRKVDTSEIFTGVIYHVNEKDYGFIREDETKESIFFHKNMLLEKVNLNDKVQYSKERSEKGFRALNISKKQ